MSQAAPSVDWKWTDYQAEVRNTLESGDYDLVVLRTGYGGGKSRCGAQWIHRGGLTDTEGTGESLVMAQDYEKGKSTTYNVFFKSLPGEDTDPFKDGDPEHSPIVSNYNKNDKILRYITGHVVWLGGADKWSRFAGSEFNRIWCDEVAHYPDLNTDIYKLHEMLVTRQRTPGGPNTTLWTSTGNGYNDFYDITERQVDRDGERLSWADRMKVVVASTEHNTLLPPDGLAKIKRQFANTERAEQGLHGGFAAPKGLVYDSFTRATHVLPHDAIELGTGALAGYDYGFKDPRVYLDIRRTPQDQYVVWDMYYRDQQPVEHLVDPDRGSGWLIEQDKPRCEVYCDHDPEHIEKLRQAGFTARKATKDIDEGIDEVRTVLETDADGRPGLIVADRCTPLIQEFMSYKEEDVGTKRATDHALDALRYAIMGDRYTMTQSTAVETARSNINR